MSLMDWFFPEYAQASSLRKISESLSARSRSSARSGGGSPAKPSEVSRDLGFLALVLFSTIGKLLEKGVLTREELLETIEELDGLDGVEDGKLDPDAVRAALGLARKPDAAEKAAKQLKIRRSRHRR